MTSGSVVASLSNHRAAPKVAVSHWPIAALIASFAFLHSSWMSSSSLWFLSYFLADILFTNFSDSIIQSPKSTSFGREMFHGAQTDSNSQCNYKPEGLILLSPPLKSSVDRCTPSHLGLDAHDQFLSSQAIDTEGWTPAI